MRFRVRHVTRYRYATPASLSYSQAVLEPRSMGTQQTLSSSLRVDPEPDDLSRRVDPLGNVVTYFSIERPHEGLAVTAVSEVDVAPSDVSPAAWRPWEQTRDAVMGPAPDREMLHESTLVPILDELAHYAAPSFTVQRPLYDAVTELTARLHRDIVFDPTATTVSTPLEEVLRSGRGVCQDLAHVTIGCLRSVGLAARYVSGYLETVPPPGSPKLVGADASHAWCSVRLADGTWLDLDPTNDAVAPERYVTLAWGRDYSEVAPLRGVVMSAESDMELSVEVDVTRLGSQTRR